MPMCLAPNSVQLFTHWDHPQGAFEVARVDRYLPVVQIHGQPDPAITDIRQRSKKGAARQEACLLNKLPVDLVEEAARQWTPEQMARRAELIRTWNPWVQSTGPSTQAGKKT